MNNSTEPSNEPGEHPASTDTVSVTTAEEQISPAPAELPIDEPQPAAAPDADASAEASDSAEATSPSRPDSLAAPPGFGTGSGDTASADEQIAPGHRPVPQRSEKGRATAGATQGSVSIEPQEATPVSAADAPEEGNLPAPGGKAPAAADAVWSQSSVGKLPDESVAPESGTHSAISIAEAAAVEAAPSPNPLANLEHLADQESSPPVSAGDEEAAETFRRQQEASREDESGDDFRPEIPPSMDFDRTWQRIEDSFKEGRVLSALVVDRVKGGLVVDIGMQGFVPASHVSVRKVNNLDAFIGRTLQLRITDLDRERQRVVLSARVVEEEEHVRRKKETLDRLKVGLITDGTVRRLTDFGAFVDIGGMDGLLHVTEMSWSRVAHPKDVLSPGDKIKVKVLKISDDRRKISLGMRQLLPDPWTGIEQQFKVGEITSGRVTRAAEFGAFVQVKDGVEAILPRSEIASRRPRAEEMPQVGDTVQAKVIELKPAERRMTLSIRRIQEDTDKKEYQQHVQSRPDKGGTTIGDMFGDILADWHEERKKDAE